MRNANSLKTASSLRNANSLKTASSLKTECNVCIHRCNLEENQIGLCRARKNVKGNIISNNYGKISSLALDPIEKKPLYHFYPGSKILSVGSYGCNLNCSFCQNHSISMANEEELETVEITPEELVDKADYYRNIGNIGVAFTYNEPLIGYEFVRDTSTLLHQRGLKSVVVTNGSVTAEIAEEILPVVDALNIDLKGFTSQFYNKISGALELVKNFIVFAAAKCHVELTTLIIPGENDSPREMNEMSRWIASVDKNIPLHVTRFFPQWKMRDRESTEISIVFELAEEARKYLNHVYEGNC